MKHGMLSGLAAMCLVAASVAGAEAGQVSVEGRYWSPDLSAHVRSGSTGTTVDVKGDLGLRDEAFGEARLAWRFGESWQHRLRLGYLPIRYSGSNRISQDIEFGGRTYTVNTVVDSRLEMDYWRLDYRYDFLRGPGGRVGLQVGLLVFDVEASLSSAGVQTRATVQAPIPALGLGIHLTALPLVDVLGEINGMSLGQYGRVVDAELAVGVHVFPFVWILGGYRVVDIQGEQDDDKANVKISGPFLGVQGRF